MKGQFAAVAGYLPILALAIIFGGDTLIGLVGGIHLLPYAFKDVYAWTQENKIYFFFMMFFGSSIIQTQCMASGAFEIYINGNLEFSKLNNH